MARMINDNMDSKITSFGFNFSSTRVEKLGSSEYTLVTIALDMSSSVASFKNELITCIKAIIEALQFSPENNNLMVRVVCFGSDVYEEHGFMEMGQIDLNTYDQMDDPRGMTALYDGTLNALEAMNQYGADLMQNDYDVNGVLYVLTDGCENASSISNGVKSIIDTKNKIAINESLLSLDSYLIGVNLTNPSVKQYLNDFNAEAGFDEFIDIGKADKDTLAKFMRFVVKSVSVVSQSLTSGQNLARPTF